MHMRQRLDELEVLLWKNGVLITPDVREKLLELRMDILLVEHRLLKQEHIKTTGGKLEKYPPGEYEDPVKERLKRYGYMLPTFDGNGLHRQAQEEREKIEIAFGAFTGKKPEEKEE